MALAMAWHGHGLALVLAMVLTMTMVLTKLTSLSVTGPATVAGGQSVFIVTPRPGGWLVILLSHYH